MKGYWRLEGLNSSILILSICLTVTMLLKPVIVSAHLLGGMATLALLTWIAHRRKKQAWLWPSTCRSTHLPFVSPILRVYVAYS